MNQLEDAIATLKQRLGTMREGLADDLEALLETAGRIEAEVEQREGGQQDLVDELARETSRADALEEQLRQSEGDVSRVKAELDTKGELVKALRQRLDEASELKAEASKRDQQIEGLRQELERKDGELAAQRSEAESLRAELEEAELRASEESVVDSAELAALKTELEARKTMIRSLKADASRTDALRTQLEAKRATINELEEAVDEQTRTIAELRQSVETWRMRYRQATGTGGNGRDVAEEIAGETPADDSAEFGVSPDPGETLPEIETFTESELEVLNSLDEAGDDAAEKTIAIDMRDPLQQARRERAGADSS